MKKLVTATVLLISALLVTCFLLLPAAAQKASFPKPQNNLALAEPTVKELLPLMPTNSEGKLSKQQYMTFMEAEFDRLDAQGAGQLDVATLTRQNQPSSAFLGK